MLAPSRRHAVTLGLGTILFVATKNIAASGVNGPVEPQKASRSVGEAAPAPGAAVVGTGAGMAALDAFVRSTRSARADFTQVVTVPGRDGAAARSRTSSGTFAFARPDRFRFDYLRPFEQTIVADGQTLWVHDVDLNQVTARNQAQVLGQTPAALIASSADLAALRQAFALADGAPEDGLQWVVATPKGRDAQLVAVRVGFANAAGGAPSLAAFAADGFRFTPPAGAALLRQ
jgi:outer membrane lipoprotein carrier protein